MKPRFLLDEHINRAIQRQLRRLDVRIDVLAIGDSGAPDAGAPDPDILDWLERNSYVLVTRNRRTIPAYLTERWAAGRHIPGIFWIRPGVGIGRVRDGTMSCRKPRAANLSLSRTAGCHRSTAITAA